MAIFTEPIIDKIDIGVFVIIQKVQMYNHRDSAQNRLSLNSDLINSLQSDLTVRYLLNTEVRHAIETYYTAERVPFLVLLQIILSLIFPFKIHLSKFFNFLQKLIVNQFILHNRSLFTTIVHCQITLFCWISGQWSIMSADGRYRFPGWQRPSYASLVGLTTLKLGIRKTY